MAVFAALFRDYSAATRPENALEGEAACFDHVSKRAVAACQQCGRFVCQLCAVQLGEQVWCPSCVAAGRGEARGANPEQSRVLYDSIALNGLILSFLLLAPFSIITAPAAVIYAIVNWKKPLSLVRKSRWRIVVTIILGLAITAIWLSLAVYVTAHWHTVMG